jgi:hypothetical protein
MVIPPCWHTDSRRSKPNFHLRETRFSEIAARLPKEGLWTDVLLVRSGIIDSEMRPAHIRANGHRHQHLEHQRRGEAAGELVRRVVAEGPLAQAERHVREGEQRVTEQSKRIARMKADGDSERAIAGERN